MKKFLLTTLSVIFCLVPCLLFCACGSKPVALTEAEAEQAVTTALTNVAAKTDIQISMNGGEDEMIVAVKSGSTYAKMNMMGTDMEMWTVDEEGTQYTYTIMTMSVMGQTQKIYTKSVADPDNDMSDSMMEEMVNPFEEEDFVFISAEVKDGVTTIVGTMTMDDMTGTGTMIIENELITNMTVIYPAAEEGAEPVSQGISLKYDAAVVIPTMPTVDAQGNPIVWQEGGIF